ncbi:MAG: AMP-dependent synthetase [Phycisphaeraceae bacterium]|nr:AMP-dependent synthetase [Phycisphaeraceae bacterium]|tara:strand:- start:3907 stop:5469 length:1563 start_codon:yes stop_codon:yes gene_type:complete
MNIGKFLTKSAQSFPDQIAIVHGDTKFTYAQFNTRTNQLANSLRRLGVTPQQHIVVLMHNHPQMLEAIFACFKLGCGAVPVNFRLHPNEFSYIIDHSEAEIVITSSEFNESLRSVLNQLPKVRHFISLSDAEDGWLNYELLLAESSGDFKDTDVEPDDVAWLFYTSGTTGQSKGAMLTHRNLTAMTQDFFASMCPGFGRDEVVIHAAPLSHGSGLYAIPNIAKASTNIIPASKSFDPQAILSSIEKYRVTNMFGAPTMIKLLVDSPAISQFDHSSLKAIVYGGSPMLVEDLTRAIKRFGPCLVQLYGQGESPMTISYLPHEDHVLNGTNKQMKRLASAGIAHTDVEIAIVDGQDRQLPTGECGEIVTRSDLVMKGYWQNPEATAKTLRNGWLHTGDVGYLDEDGYLFLMDRSKDLIISGGENIYPREIEEVLVQHQAVREVAVIGVPDPKWGESIKAVISLLPSESVTEEDLIDFCKQHIASYKKPKSIDFMDELPKNNYGKIVKRELRDRYWKDRERSV